MPSFLRFLRPLIQSSHPRPLRAGFAWIGSTTPAGLAAGVALRARPAAYERELLAVRAWIAFVGLLLRLTNLFQLGQRAAWTVRFDSKFLDSFGRPDPNADPPCERTTDTTVVQALHLMNAPGLAAKITAENGRAAKLAAGQSTPVEIVEELYLLAYCRKPTAEESAACAARFAKPGATRKIVTEDLLWALINTPEFAFAD